MLLSLFLIILHLFCDCFVSLLHPILSHLLFCVYVLCHLWLFCIFLRSFFIHSSQSDFSVRNKNPRPKNILDRRTPLNLFCGLPCNKLFSYEWSSGNNGFFIMDRVQWWKPLQRDQSKRWSQKSLQKADYQINKYSSWLALVATDLIWQGSAQNNPSERLIWPIHVSAELVFW